MQRNLRQVALRDDRRFGRRLGLVCACAIALFAALALNLWFRTGGQASAPGVSLDAVHAAYAEVVAGKTAAPELADLGFDTSRPGVKRLSYLGLLEYFAPRNSDAFDRLDPAAQKCLAGPDGCNAYLFHIARPGADQGLVDAAHAADGPGVEVLFLIHDGRVAYKAMRGI